MHEYNSHNPAELMDHEVDSVAVSLLSKSGTTVLIETTRGEKIKLQGTTRYGHPIIKLWINGMDMGPGKGKPHRVEVSAAKGILTPGRSMMLKIDGYDDSHTIKSVNLEK